jgi:sigma-B regulation protein RsbU (phosphoserine phosphatase)
MQAALPDDEALRAELKHELRTLLNHISGYSEILAEDGREFGHESLARRFDAIREAAAPLKKAIIGCFAAPGPDILASCREVLAGPLYELVSEVQAARGECAVEGGARFLPDIDKVLASANSILDLVSGPSADGQRSLFADEAERPASPETALHRGRILVVDDDDLNRRLLSRYLERLGHEPIEAANGQEALERLKRERVDLVLLDYMMPVMNGFQLLERMQGDEQLQTIPVIMISMLDDSTYVARCIGLGAEDFLPKDFNPIILNARIESCLARKLKTTEDKRRLSRLIDEQRRMAQELGDASAYVQSLLPKRLDDERVEASLLSVSVMNMLKTRALAGVDYADPASVLASLNRSFKIEEQNNMFFSIWYGVYDAASRSLSYSSGGASPGIIFAPDASARELSTGNIIIGVDQDSTFSKSSIAVPENSILYLFSDGAYEVRLPEGGLLGLGSFIGILRARRYDDLESILEAAKSAGKPGEGFEDDVSLLRIRFK